MTRRWLGFLLVVGLLAWGALELGNWQFRRLDERRQDNAIIVHNLAAAPAPVSDVLKADTEPAASQEWREVTATGTWQAADTVVVRYRTHNGDPGVEVVTPLKLADGTAVLVDRGWMPTKNSGMTNVTTPAPTAGVVTVSGYVRLNGTGSSIAVTGHSTRSVSSDAIGKTLDYPLLSGFLNIAGQSPAATDGLQKPDLPTIDDGPHFFYGLQWWFFGALALGGFSYLAYDEWRRSQRPEHPAVDGDDGTVDV